MVDDLVPNGPATGLGLGDVVDMLRDDAAAAELRGRRGLDDMERRVMAAIGDVRTDLSHYVDTHGGEHTAMRTTTETAHARYDAFLAANALDQARRDGALGVVRYLADLAGRNWKALAATAAAIAAMTGNVHVVIGG